VAKEAAADVRRGLPDLEVEITDGTTVVAGEGKSRKAYSGGDTLVLPAGEALSLVTQGQARLIGEA
jgi:hypothetical protein